MSVLRFPTRLGTVLLTAPELELLAAAIEADAAAHDKRPGSCPADLWAATERAKQLRSLAAELRGASR